MSGLKGARILVTGGAGFIGSHLVGLLLESGAEQVDVIDNFFLGKECNLADAKTTFGQKLNVFREDAAEFDALKAVVKISKPDMIFNLATKALEYSFFNPAGACRVNLDIAIGLAELLRESAYSRLIHYSSSEVYGSAKQLPMSEDHPLLAETSYAAGKAAGDLLLRSYVNMFDLDIVTIRPFNNYGPCQNDGAMAAVVPLTIKRLTNNEPPVLSGDGSQTRDFIYVGDTVINTLKVAESAETTGDTFNLGTGREISIREIVETLADIMGYDGEIKHVERRTADVDRHCADIGFIESKIGPLTLTSLREGLQKTVDWYRK